LLLLLLLLLSDVQAAHGGELAKADLAVHLAHSREAAQAKAYQQAMLAASASEAKALAADDTCQAALATQAASLKELRSLKVRWSGGLVPSCNLAAT
jgi:hypothetical protein